ncbi:hypothetical protein J4227_04910 [Candidatus Woesearchaeota archaeon]|nr:hypothetical protein [Candidatus Woesearchaeota archaeon]
MGGIVQNGYKSGDQRTPSDGVCGDKDGLCSASYGSDVYPLCDPKGTYSANACVDKKNTCQNTCNGCPHHDCNDVTTDSGILCELPESSAAACGDGNDNDGDGFIDLADLSCETDGNPCTSGAECTGGVIPNFCTDTNGDGGLDTCTRCDGTRGSMCGSLAQQGTTYGVCTGSGFYQCSDQSTADGDPACNKNSGNPDPGATNAGGIMTVAGVQGRNFIRCGGNDACTGTANLGWTSSKGGTNIGGGFCAPVDISAPAITYDDLNDASDNKIALSDTLKIKVNSLYTGTAGQSPDWTFLFSCILNTGIAGKNFCDQSPAPGDNYEYMLGIGKTAAGGTSTAEYLFEPMCNVAYLGTRSVGTATAFTGSFADNNWWGGQSASNPSFDVVECETNNDCNLCPALGGSMCVDNFCTAVQHGESCELDPASCSCEPGLAKKQSFNLITNPSFEGLS